MLSAYAPGHNGTRMKLSESKNLCMSRKTTSASQLMRKQKVTCASGTSHLQPGMAFRGRAHCRAGFTLQKHFVESLVSKRKPSTTAPSTAVEPWEVFIPIPSSEVAASMRGWVSIKSVVITPGLSTYA